MKLAKNGHVLFIGGGPDALNDLKFVSHVESLSVYYMPKNQISETKKNLSFFRDLGFDLQGHPRSKVMVSNKSLIMFSYLTLIVTIWLTSSVSEIWSLKGFRLTRLIRLITLIRSMSKTIATE